MRPGGVARTKKRPRRVVVGVTGGVGRKGVPEMLLTRETDFRKERSIDRGKKEGRVLRMGLVGKLRCQKPRS